MRNIIRFFKYTKKNGLIAAIMKVVNYYINSRKWRRITKIETLEGRFTEIFKSNAWGGSDSVSGTGSSLEATELLRSSLPSIFKELRINSIFDAPCGDFSWFKLIISSNDIEYIGADIVSNLVENNNLQNTNDNISFIKMDITENEFPRVDLMFCRDCLFHLSFNDIRKVLVNFVNSDIEYLMTTTHINLNEFENSDIATGDYRKIDLFSEPFCFPRDTIAEVDDWLEPEPRRKMCVWTRDQIKNIMVDGV